MNTGIIWKKEINANKRISFQLKSSLFSFRLANSDVELVNLNDQDVSELSLAKLPVNLVI